VASDKTARRLSRILSVLPYVIDNPGADIDEVAERFGYGTKSDLVKDLHLVFVTGLPGYGPGDLIDVDIDDDEVYVDAADYFARPIRLTAPEALGLLAAGMTLLESDQAPPALATAVDKLMGVIGHDAASSVAFDVPTPAEVVTLRRAIETGKVVRIDYLGLASNARTVRDVEGSTVSFSLGNWYLTGHCRRADDERVFRVDRIASIEVLDEDYEPEDVEHTGPVVYQPSESDARVSFTVGDDAAWVAEYYPVDVRATDDGRLRVQMAVADPLVAARLLLQLGDEASEIDGEEVVAAMDDLRARIVTRYLREE
jgi:proteasome accessory factor C